MKPIKGYDNYLISAFGHVLNTKTGKILKPYYNKTVGYYYITLSKKSIQTCLRLNRLVALSWIENPLELPEVNHKYGNKLNNYFINIEWCTSSQNRQHAFDMGLQEKTRELCRQLGKRRVIERSKKIIQFEYNSGKYINEYSSTREAARMTNINQRDISNTANKKQKYTKMYGFVFEIELSNKECCTCIVESINPKKIAS